MSRSLRELVAIRYDAYDHVAGKALTGMALAECELSIHLPGWDGDPMTLCGIGAGNNDVQVPLPRGARVTCAGCLRVWEQAKSWQPSVFSPDVE